MAGKTYKQKIRLQYWCSVSDCCGTVAIVGRGEIRRCTACDNICKPKAVINRTIWSPPVLVPYDAFERMLKAACEAIGEAIHEGNLRHELYEADVTLDPKGLLSVAWQALN